MALGLILMCHAGAFVALFGGRHQRVPCCGSDVVLIHVPFVLAAIAYAVVYRGLIRIPNPWLRGGLVLLSSVGSAGISMAIGMAIAFNRWGT